MLYLGNLTWRFLCLLHFLEKETLKLSEDQLLVPNPGLLVEERRAREACVGGVNVWTGEILKN